MNTGTWKSLKSPVMSEIRIRLKKKSEKGQPPISNKEANRAWREDILGIFSEEQKKIDKQKRQERNTRNKQVNND
jgi:hypothetical protein